MAAFDDGIREAAWQFERATADMLSKVAESDTSPAELHCLAVYLFASAAARYLNFDKVASFEACETLIRLTVSQFERNLRDSVEGRDGWATRNGKLH